MKRLLLISIIVIVGFAQYGSGQPSAKDEAEKKPASPGIVYSNPWVYNVDYSFEMVPDPNKIDRAKDLKVWLPIPQEWESQKAVRIISVQPEPHARYVDPEYGNPMLFWDFGKMPKQASYKVDLQFRLESYQIDVDVDPDRVGSYDKTSPEYALYTRSTHTVHITPKIRELAQKAIDNEKNPFLQAKRILFFAKRKMHYKILDYERGRGIDCLLAYPVTDEKTGQEHYEGCCNQTAALIVAMCRAVGIPARCVSVYGGWVPWIERGDAKAAYPFDTKLSPEGLAATRFFGGLGGHMSAEFLIPNYGWIPINGGTVGHSMTPVWIRSKGRDILLGPGAPPEDGQGYGTMWVALHDGRADRLSAILNIAKIHTSKVTLLHHSDPFPADGLARYMKNLALSDGAENDLRSWRKKTLRWSSYLARNSVPDALTARQFYKDHPRAKAHIDAFICHMLRRQLGDEKFFELVRTYLDLRRRSGQAVPTSHFQRLAEDISGQSLDWFFRQWVDRMDVPRLKLEQVAARKEKEGWQVKGHLQQLGKTTFRLPIELALDTANGREMQTFWMDDKTLDFDFHTRSEPRKLIVDPDCEIFRVQKMAPRLGWFSDAYPSLIIVYGTLGETEANKTAAERLNKEELIYGRECVKADIDVNDADLKAKCVFLIGRPETNLITQQFKDIFPIKFDKNRFTWQGTTYAQPTQAVAQIAENPRDATSLMIMHAGLSPEATQALPYRYLYAVDGTYVIFDGGEQLLAGDWEDADGNLYWNFDKDPSTQ